jgi:ATP-dependent exoDNAse (exonuclease V) beta subunit
LGKNASFKIYNASAGSGKTFTLVKEYLLCVLRSKNEGYYQHLLAITFTNKAVAEMKQRILEALILFADEDAIMNPPEMLLQISDELQQSISQIHLQSKKIVKHLLHHYASFSIETIDSFNHRLIRTFARDLKLTSNFEVSLDTAQLLSEAVDQLLSKTGEDSGITKVLLDFALGKTDDDKSWDISKDIASAAGVLFNENDAPHVAKLKQKSLEDFTKFNRQLLQQKKSSSEKIIEIAESTLALIEESSLEYSDFSGSYLPKFFHNLASEKFDINFNLKWQSDMGNKPLYPARVDKNIGGIIDELTPLFISNFDRVKKQVHHFQFIDSILKNLTPLSVINLVSKEIEAIKDEKNIIPISEFNALINKEIKDQPAPFIYERLGEKYRHFFIDEFQDTSQLQWENLKPLIDNALSQQDPNEKSGSLLLVGDAKQSIYRWRGGLPEQFMDLYTDKNPFPSAEKKVSNLEVNYRSCKEIINFNNQFFSFASTLFGDEIHKRLYESGNKQLFNPKEAGYIKFEFIEKQLKDAKDETYSKRIYETILDLRTKGFADNDICILTRNKKDGIFLGNFLMEHGVTVISSETLLLNYSPLVQCLVDSLKLSVQPDNQEVKINLLNFIHNHFLIPEEKHSFFLPFINASANEFTELLKSYTIDYNSEHLRTLSLYESCEYIIRQFQLQKVADTFLYSFMDFIYEFSRQPQADKISFLDTWEIEKDKVSIPANEGVRAVQLMTIHKAKGLEFPVVLFPFADVKIYDTKNDALWFPLDTNLGLQFEEAPVNYKKEMMHFGEQGEALYNEHHNQLELDSINLLYVTLTRAIEQLYIFAERPTEIRSEGPANYNQVFGEFLKHIGKWNGEQFVYEFGNSHRIQESESFPFSKYTSATYITTSPSDHHLKIATSEGALWETDIQAAITEGNLLHDAMAQIHTDADITAVFEAMDNSGNLTAEEIALLKFKIHSIIDHPQLKSLFKASARVENEKEIITASGMLLRPDRLNFNEDDSVTIIDYKTGVPNYQHEDQINSYASAIEQMGKIVSEKILVYTNREEIVINKV